MFFEVSEKGLAYDVGRGMLLVGKLAAALGLVVMALDAARGHTTGWTRYDIAASAVALGAGGILTRRSLEAVRATLEGLLITFGYLSVYFLDQLIEVPSARGHGGWSWLGASVAALTVTTAIAYRLRPTLDFHGKDRPF